MTVIAIICRPVTGRRLWTSCMEVYIYSAPATNSLAIVGHWGIKGTQHPARTVEQSAAALSTEGGKSYSLSSPKSFSVISPIVAVQAEPQMASERRRAMLALVGGPFVRQRCINNAKGVRNCLLPWRPLCPSALHVLQCSARLFFLFRSLSFTAPRSLSGY